MTHLFPFFLVSIMYTFMFFAGTFQRFWGFCSDGETGLFNQCEQVTKASRCRTENSQLTSAALVLLHPAVLGFLVFPSQLKGVISFVNYCYQLFVQNVPF